MKQIKLSRRTEIAIHLVVFSIWGVFAFKPFERGQSDVGLIFSGNEAQVLVKAETKYFNAHQRLPSSNMDVGMNSNDPLSDHDIDDLQIKKNGDISFRLSDDVGVLPQYARALITMHPIVWGGRIKAWGCSSSKIDEKKLDKTVCADVG